MNWFKYRTAITLALFATIFIGLTVVSYIKTSATYDEPTNLVSGYAMLKYHDYRFSPDHVPLLRMWAAIPLAFMDVKFDPDVLKKIETRDPSEWLYNGVEATGHDFMYDWNDADRLLYAARFMMTLLGVALGILLFCWARDLFGFYPAVFALSLYALEPNILANSPLVDADIGLAFGIFGAAYFLWRTCRLCSFWNVAGLCVFTALSLVGKFWGLGLLLIIPVLLILRVSSKTPWRWSFRTANECPSLTGKICMAFVIWCILLVACFWGIWAAYNFQYRLAAKSTQQFHFENSDSIKARSPEFAGAVGWLDRNHVLPSAYLQGMLFGSMTLVKRDAFLMGQNSPEGWWYYFPIAFLIKTSVTLLLLSLVGLGIGISRARQYWRTGIYILFPPLVFTLIAMAGHIDIGLRYIALVYPFVILLATLPIAECLKRGFRWMGPLFVLTAAIELGSVYPHCLAFFNGFVGGPRNGYLYLADSNLDWGQDLKGLKRWMDQNKVEQVNLAYFGSADPRYYHLNCNYLIHYLYDNKPLHMELPGYVAVSTTYLDGVYLRESDRTFFQPLLNEPLVATIGYSINIYYVDKK